MKLGTITLKDLGVIGLEVSHFIKMLQGDKKLEEKFKAVTEAFNKGEMKTVEKIIRDVDINTFIDENLYSDAVKDIKDKKLIKHLDTMMYKLAKGTKAKPATDEEEALARNTIACVATNPKEDRRIERVKEMADCKDVAALKKLIYARGWDRPDEAIANLMTAFKEKAMPGIAKGFEKAGEGIKNAADKLSAATKQSNQEMGQNLESSGLVAWSERLLAKSKK